MVTGAPTRACSYDDLAGTIYRAGQQSIWTPPHEPKVRVVVNDKGEVSYSLLDIGNPGSPPVNKQIGTRKNIAETVYWLEAPASLHQCRHVAATACE